ncbi:unnamed protein product [Onchocerca flexuosa]|uniref:Nucleoporin_C domain-containing protein n=1 Tax=Onchocerca flexuosa TaxID=387005 RepID=A0A183I3L9_9BILA|nr:unnamed protein product [Onchocerca flexuosa]
MPGEESFRCSRDALTLADKLQTALHELCSAVTSSRQVIVSGHIFAPREYLAQQLESQLTQSIQTLISSSEHPMRPCQLLASINAHMIVLQNLDTIVTLDMTRLFNSVLLQQTQYQDYHGNDTLTSIYTKWYLEVVLRRMSTGQILFSPHFAALIANPDYQQTFSPDQYTDNRELRALSLLLGPYGVKTMSEKLIWHVASQITELNKIVNDHRDALILARSCFDKPEKMRELLMQLSGDIKDRKQLASNGLLRTSEDSSDVDTAKSRQFVYVVLDQLVKHSPLLSFDLLESCFPYNLIRSSYQYCYHLEELK